VTAQQPPEGPADTSFLPNGPGSDAAITYFYGHLFAADPEIRAMFPAAMAQQRDRLASALAYLARAGEENAAYLADLGRAHRKFGVREEHYEAFRQALTATLRKFADGPRSAADCLRAFDRDCEVMKNAANEDASRSPAWWVGEITGHELRGTDLAVLTVQPGEEFDYLPGQHVSVQTPHWPRLWRTYSIANAPRADGALTLHVRAVRGGLVSTALVHHCGPGDTLFLGAAAGRMTADTESSRDVLCLAGGTGLAPLKAIIEAISSSTTPGKRREIVLYHGVRRQADLYDLGDLRKMELDYPWLQVLPVTSEETADGVMGGTIPQIASRASWDGRDVYVSGPDEMIVKTVRVLAGLGIPSDRLGYDLTAEMAATV
jgi:NAD(P)H-flavin reductase/hemoglobin-like flavoprotein